MSKRDEFLGRIGKAGSRLFVSAGAMRDELGSLTKGKLAKLARELKLVTRDEFAEVEAMLVAARRAQEKMAAQIAELESRAGVKSKSGGTSGRKKVPSKRGAKSSKRAA